MKIRPMGAELFHADRRTDTTKLIVVCRNFANAPNKITHRRSDSLQPRRTDCDGKLQSICCDSKILCLYYIACCRITHKTRWIIFREFLNVRFTENPALRRLILQRYERRYLSYPVRICNCRLLLITPVVR